VWKGYVSSVFREMFWAEDNWYRQNRQLVNNAGVNKIDTIGEITYDDWDLINAVNLHGPLLIGNTLRQKGSIKYGKAETNHKENI